MRKYVTYLSLFLFISQICKSQTSSDIFRKINNSVNLNKWYEINSINIVYENIQKNITDTRTFEQIGDNYSSIESFICDKLIGSRFEIRFGKDVNSYYILEKNNKKYFSITSNIKDNKPDITYHNEDDIDESINFMISPPKLDYLTSLLILESMSDSLNFEKEIILDEDTLSVLVSPKIINPSYRFYIDNNFKMRGYEYIRSNTNQKEFYFDFINENGLIVPKVIYKISDKYENLYRLSNLQLNLNYSKSLFY